MNNKLIDLHTHSIFSDGELTPNELCEMAINNGVGMLSITDHNTTKGFQNLIESGSSYENLVVIPGIELDANITKGKMHILGYGIDVYDKSLESLSKRMNKVYLEKFRAILDILKKDYAICFDEEEIENLINSKFQVGKSDAVMLLLKHGYVDSTLKAYDLFVNPILDNLNMNFSAPTYEEVIYTIKKAGGVSSLAHPKSLKRDYIELNNLIKQLKNCGLNAIEVYHSSHSKKEQNLYLNLASKHHMYISGGSDYHGIVAKPSIEIGKGNDNLNIKNLSILKKIN